MTDRIDDLEGHQFVGQQSQRPLAITGWRLSQSQGDQLRFPLAVESWRRRRRFAFLAVQRRLKTIVHQTLSQILDRLHAAMISIRDPRVSPGRTIRIRLQEDLSAANLL